MWFIFALLSAIFAALTSILAKVGIGGVNSHLATAIRTVVVVIMSWGMVFLTNTQSGISEISKKSWLFLILSGLATGASWICYYKALQLGEVSKVVPIDKLSVVITLVLAFIFLHEEFTAKSLIGCVLISAGTLIMVLQFQVWRGTNNNPAGVSIMEKTQFRFAEEKDIPLILQFIKELAEYEKMLDEVVATEALLKEWIFDKKKAEVIFALENGNEVGFALFFHNFSTFLGRAGIYLEDLFVKPEYRSKGYGKALLKELARIAVERGCGRLEWWCLNWNKPSIDFYLSLGAEPMNDWTVYRIAGDTLNKLAE